MSVINSGLNFGDIWVNQGIDWFSNMNFNSDDGTGVNITGYQFAAQAKTSYYTANVAANFIISIVNAVAGQAVLYLPANVSANMAAGNYVYDVTMKDTSNNTTRIVEGTLHLRPGVTNITPPNGGLSE